MDEQQGHLIFAQIFRLPFWLRVSILLPILTVAIVLHRLIKNIQRIKTYYVELWLFAKTGIDKATEFNYITGEFEIREIKPIREEEILTYKGIPVANMNADTEDSLIRFNDDI